VSSVKPTVQTGGLGLVQIACPSCGDGRVAFNPAAFLAGTAFTCSNCGAQLQLGEQDRDVYADGLAKLDEIAQQPRGGG